MREIVVVDKKWGIGKNNDAPKEEIKNQEQTEDEK